MIKEKWKNCIGLMIVFLAIFKFYGTYLGMGSYSKYILVISILLSTILILNDIKKYNLTHLLFLMLSGVQFLASKNITMVYTFYLCLAVYTLDFRYMMKWFVIINSVFFAGLLILNLTGINPTEYLEGRNDFGFGNPNTAFICAFLVWSGFFYLIFYSKKKIDFILLFAMIFLMYTQTETRTGLLTAVMSTVAFVILRNVDVKKKGYRIFVSSFPALMSLLSVVIAVFFSKSYLINSVLSHRPVYWNSYLMHPSKGINLFGYAANMRDILFTQRMPLDSGYIWSLYSQGSLVYIVLIFFMCYTLHILCKEEKKDIILLMVSLLIYCFAESIMIDLATNISLVAVVYGMSKIKFGDKFLEKKMNFLGKRIRKNPNL